MHEQRLTADWPVTEDGAVGGDTGNAQSRSNVVAEFVWRRHRQAFGDHGELGGRYRRAGRTAHRRPTPVVRHGSCRLRRPPRRRHPRRAHALILQAGAGEITQPIHCASSRLVPCDVKLLGCAIKQAPSQEVLSWCKFRRQCAGNRIRRQDLLIPVGHDGRHQKLIDYFGQCLRACLYFGDVRSSRVLARSCR